MADAVDLVLAQWSAQRPDVDTSPMAVLAGVTRLARLLEREQRESRAGSTWSRASSTCRPRSGGPGRRRAAEPAGEVRTTGADDWIRSALFRTVTSGGLPQAEGPVNRPAGFVAQPI
jgi:hypothetical protein